MGRDARAREPRNRGSRAPLRVLGLAGVALAVALSGCKPSARTIAEDLSRSTLYVETFDGDGKPLSQGSAFFIGRDTAITNMHVMKWAKTLKVSSPTRGVSFDALSVTGVDFDRDLCVLRLSSKEGRPLRFASKGSVAVGDRVYVGGNPKGLTGTVSSGIVSSIRDGGKVIQIDAAVSPGSSGGPVVNELGEVLGVATLSVIDGQNLNFAVGLLGGVEVRTVDWPVADVGKLALSDRDLMFLRGPVKRVYETLESPQKGLSAFREEIIFDESGMVTTLREAALLGASPDDISTREYHDARIPSFWDGPLDYEEGKARRLQDLHFSETIDPYEALRGSPEWTVAGSHVYDAFGRATEYHMVSNRGSRDELREFDGKGRLSRETVHITDGVERLRPVVNEFTYVDDERGNWVLRREQYMDERLAEVVLSSLQMARKIEYFSER